MIRGLPMNPDRLEELMNQELDGCNTPDESRRLAEHLAGDPDARQRFRQLQDAVDVLAGWDQVDPPAGLRETILAALAETAPVVEPAQESPFRGLMRRMTLVPLAAGLVAGLLISNLMMRGSVDTDGLGGTAGAQWQDLAPQGLVPLDLAGAGASGDLWVGTRAGRTGVRLSLETDTPLEVALEMGPATACRGYRLDGDARPTLRVTRSAVVVEGATTGDYEFDFGHAADREADIRLRISREGRIVAETTVRSGHQR